MKTLSIPPDQRFPYRFRKPPFKYEVPDPSGAQPGR